MARRILSSSNYIWQFSNFKVSIYLVNKSFKGFFFPSRDKNSLVLLQLATFLILFSLEKNQGFTPIIYRKKICFINHFHKCFLILVSRFKMEFVEHNKVLIILSKGIHKYLKLFSQVVRRSRQNVGKEKASKNGLRSSCTGIHSNFKVLILFHLKWYRIISLSFFA